MGSAAHSDEVKTPGTILTEQLPGANEPAPETAPEQPAPAPEPAAAPDPAPAPGPLNEQLPAPGGN